jgi:hypothetical protein
MSYRPEFDDAVVVPGQLAAPPRRYRRRALWRLGPPAQNTRIGHRVSGLAKSATLTRSGGRAVAEAA